MLKCTCDLFGFFTVCQVQGGSELKTAIIESNFTFIVIIGSDEFDSCVSKFTTNTDHMEPNQHEPKFTIIDPDKSNHWR